MRRDGMLRQIREVLDRHPDESGIVFCITRKEVEATAAALVDAGYKALPYHAGMDDDQSRRRALVGYDTVCQISFLIVCVPSS